MANYATIRFDSTGGPVYGTVLMESVAAWERNGWVRVSDTPVLPSDATLRRLDLQLQDLVQNTSSHVYAAISTAASATSGNADATTTAKGKVQLATGAEVTAGTNADKAVTPSGAAAAYAPGGSAGNINKATAQGVALVNALIFGS